MIRRSGSARCGGRIGAWIHLPSLAAELWEEAADARQDDSLLPAWRALRLNGGVHDVAVVRVLSGADTWVQHTGEAPREGRPVWGLDLSQSEAMAAVAAYWPTTGRIDRIDRELPPSAEPRGAQAPGWGCRFVCANANPGGGGRHRGSLSGPPSRASGRPPRVAADRWRADELGDVLTARRVPRVPFHERRQGFKDGGADVRDFRRARW